MIVGGGMMARAFAGFNSATDVIIFASGVSNSAETAEAVFRRERELLTQTIARQHRALLVYFGTCSVFDPDRATTPYVRHKLAMEALISERSRSWLGLRVGLAIGPMRGGNTLHEFIYERVVSRQPIDLWTRAVRYPIDVEDVVRMVSHLVGGAKSHNRLVNVALHAYPAAEIVRIIEDIVGCSARATPLDKGLRYSVDCDEALALANKLGVDTASGYLERVLRKYIKA